MPVPAPYGASTPDLPPVSVGSKSTNTLKLTHLINFDPEDGSRMYVWNAGNTSHTKHEGPKSRLNINAPNTLLLEGRGGHIPCALLPVVGPTGNATAQGTHLGKICIFHYSTRSHTCYGSPVSPIRHCPFARP
jgi:hypothetical protein